MKSKLEAKEWKWYLQPMQVALVITMFLWNALTVTATIYIITHWSEGL